MQPFKIGASKLLKAVAGRHGRVPAAVPTGSLQLCLFPNVTVRVSKLFEFIA